TMSSGRRWAVWSSVWPPPSAASGWREISPQSSSSAFSSWSSSSGRRASSAGPRCSVMLNDYTADIAILILIYIPLGASLNLLIGYGGQFSMAQAVFYGIGAYAAGLLAVNYGYSPLLSVIGAIVVSFISAGILALPAAKRVSGEYLILLTLAFQIVVNQLMNT